MIIPSNNVLFFLLCFENWARFSLQVDNMRKRGPNLVGPLDTAGILFNDAVNC